MSRERPASSGLEQLKNYTAELRRKFSAIPTADEENESKRIRNTALVERERAVDELLTRAQRDAAVFPSTLNPREVSEEEGWAAFEELAGIIEEMKRDKARVIKKLGL